VVSAAHVQEKQDGQVEKQAPVYFFSEVLSPSKKNYTELDKVLCWGRASVRRRSHTKKQLRLKSSPRDGRRSLFMELRRFKPT
jgi:hypothetical protein